MKKYRHTRRSVILYLLLTPLTIFIYPMVVWAHIRKEVNLMYEGREGYKKSMPFIGVFFLGIITLGIVPMVWSGRISRKVGAMGTELGIAKPHTSFASYFWLCWFFAALIVTYIIGMTKFLHTVNAVERALNEKADAEAKAAAEAEILVKDEQPEALPAPEEAAAPAEEEKPAEEAVESKDADLAPAYQPVTQEKPRRYQVRYANSDKPIKYFDTREEAVAYAKGLAARRHAHLKVKK